MKRTNLPLSALISGLLAVPGLGLAPRAPSETQAPSALVSAEAFPAEMPGEVAELMRRIARGEKPDAGGMQLLSRRLALQMQQRLAGTPGGNCAGGQEV